MQWLLTLKQLLKKQPLKKLLRLKKLLLKKLLRLRKLLPSNLGASSEVRKGGAERCRKAPPFSYACN